jgi:hypothetical protein
MPAQRLYLLGTAIRDTVGSDSDVAGDGIERADTFTGTAE